MSDKTKQELQKEIRELKKRIAHREEAGQFNEQSSPLLMQETLAEYAMYLLETGSQGDINQILAEKLRSIVGKRSIVVVNSIDEKRRTLKTKGIAGMARSINQVKELLKKSPKDITYNAEDQRLNYLKDGKLHDHVIDLYNIFLGVIPKAVCKTIISVIKLEKIYTIGLTLRNALLGTIVIFSLEKDLSINREMIETVVRLSSLAIMKQRAEAKIHLEQSKSQTYLETTKVIMLVLDGQGNITLINQKGCDVMGYNKKEMIGKNWFNNFLPDNIKKETKRVFSKLLKGEIEGVEHYENSILTKSGVTRLIAWHNSYLRDEDGGINIVLCSGEDITDRKKADEDLRLKEVVFNSSISANSIADTKGLITQVNPSFLAIWGYSKKDEVIGLPISHFLQSQKKAREIVRELESYDRWRGTYLARKKDGSTFTAYALATVLRDNKNKIIGYQSSVMDITAQQNAEKAKESAFQQIKASEQQLKASEQQQKALNQQLKSSEQQLRTNELQLILKNQEWNSVFNSLNDVLVILNEDYSIERINNAGIKLLSMKRRDIIGKRCYEIFFNRKNPCKKCHLLDLKEGRSPKKDFLPREIRGRQFITTVSIFPVKSKGGQKKYVDTLHDVTKKINLIEKMKSIYEIINISSEVVFLWKNDPNWTIEFVSSNVRKLFGYTKQDLEGGKIKYGQIIHPDDIGRVSDEVVKFSSSRRRRSFTHLPYRIITKNSKEIWILDKTFIRRDAAGNITHYMGILSDHTKLTEAKISQENFAKREKTIAEIGKVALRGKDLDKVFMEVLDIVKNFFGAKAAMLAKCKSNSNEMILISQNGFDGNLTEWMSIDPGKGCGRCIPQKSLRTVLIKSFMKNGEWLGPKFLEQRGIVMGVCAGIAHENEPWGILGVYFQDQKMISTKQKNFLRSVGLILSFAITRSRKQDQLEDSIKYLNYTLKNQKSLFQQLKASEQQLKAGEEQLHSTNRILTEKTNILQERMKEVNCLYQVSNLSGREDLGIEDYLQSLVEIIPGAMQYPKDTLAHISIEGKEYGSKNHFKAKFKASSKIEVNNRIIGFLEVSVGNDKSDAVKKGFLREEKQLLGLITDYIGKVIAKKHAAEEIESHREKYKLLFENNPVNLHSLNNKRVVVQVNNTWLSTLGYRREDIIGTNFVDLLTDNYKEAFRDTFSEFLKIGEVSGVEFDVIKSDGTILQVRFEGKCLYDDAGKFERTLCAFLDISEEKKMKEEEYKISRLESLSVLSAGIAHDFNNYLAGILTNLSILKLDIPPESRLNQSLIEMEKVTFGAKSLTEQLLDFSKGGKPQKQDLDLTEFLISTVKFTLSGSNTHFVQAIADNLWDMSGDKGQLNRLFGNLLINSQQAMPSGGDITVKAGNIELQNQEIGNLKSGKYVLITIKDTGLGIPEENIPNVFDPFFTTKQSGSGLGLSSAYRIIERHQGHIDIASILGEGTTVNIYLPALGKKGRASESPEKLMDFIGKGRILFMDDQKYLRDSTTKILNKFGFEVVAVKSEAEAIREYGTAYNSNEPFVAIILDLTIPGGQGGLWTMQEILKIDPTAKAIVSSGYSNQPVMSDPQKFGFKGAVAKPFMLNELIEIIREVLEI